MRVLIYCGELPDFREEHLVSAFHYLDTKKVFRLAAGGYDMEFAEVTPMLESEAPNELAITFETQRHLDCFLEWFRFAVESAADSFRMMLD